MFRFGVVGLGLGRWHAETILKHPADWTVTAVCDALPNRVAQFAENHPDIRGFTDFDVFLAEAEIDAVILAMPHDLHEPMTVQSLEAGKHVLVEKPMARNQAECERMNAAAQRTGKTLMIGQNWRYTPWVHAVKAIVDSGELGDLRVVRSDWLQNAIGDKRPGNWLLDGTRAGGGPIISLMCHNLDFLRYLLGEPEEVHTFAITGHPEFPNNAESWGLAQFRFQNGTIGQMFTSYAAFNPDYAPLNLYSDDGTIQVRQNQDIYISSRKREVDFQQLAIDDNAGLPTSHATTNGFLHFVDCIQSGTEPLSGGIDNIKSVRFIEAMYNSARTGQVVRLDN